jgi:hypothetical protein
MSLSRASPLLLAGDNYRRDLDHGVGFHLNQGSPLLHQVGVGTRKVDGLYALAAELVISAKTMNPVASARGRGLVTKTVRSSPRESLPNRRHRRLSQGDADHGVAEAPPDPRCMARPLRYS